MGPCESLGRVAECIQLGIAVFWQFVAVCLSFARSDSVALKTKTSSIFSVQCLFCKRNELACEQFIEIVFLCFA
jgi:hypothetical protein